MLEKLHIYNPDRWVILRINTPEYGIVDKILCSWAGSYTYGSSWKLSSGICTFNEGESKELYVSKQDSGSIYELHKGSEGMSAIMASFLENLRDNLPQGGSVEVIAAKDYKEKV